ncbi:TetR/AcrR family transcriptional regulator [Mycobacterium sp. AZCC_0083]|uniref:TetR/AcrR family transcriptional regulator n=1 Tax=Mycobacterium sp. AZCC_0083 TaxID=2735882 RepID=UPI00161ECEDE|nr:TetR/AcrR family transcriptional regulator [Mycobacterium sp. AZCC_0083]MBB5164282.1 AcrR family transcriptional regulator [Mycobacterium sp. AZCC_0083]
MADDFQRARTPEQRGERVTEIHRAVVELLGDTPVDQISLRMVATRVGLAASNVLRHAGSREELFLDVMDEQYVAWIADLSADLNHLGTPAPVDAVATLIATSLLGRTTLHRLIEASPELLRHTASRSGARNRIQGERNCAALTTLVEAALGTSFNESDRLYFVAGLHAVVSAAGAWSRQTLFPVEAERIIQDLLAILLAGLVSRV